MLPITTYRNAASDTSEITESDPARPSTPSEQFVAFIVTNSTNPMLGMYAHHGILHTTFIADGSHTSTHWSGPLSASHTKNATPRHTVTSSRPFLSCPQGLSDRSSR